MMGLNPIRKVFGDVDSTKYVKSRGGLPIIGTSQIQWEHILQRPNLRYFKPDLNAIKRL